MSAYFFCPEKYPIFFLKNLIFKVRIERSPTDKFENT